MELLWHEIELPCKDRDAAVKAEIALMDLLGKVYRERKAPAYHEVWHCIHAKGRRIYYLSPRLAHASMSSLSAFAPLALAAAPDIRSCRRIDL